MRCSYLQTITSFCHNSRICQTDRLTDRRTDVNSKIVRMHLQSHGKNEVPQWNFASLSPYCTCLESSTYVYVCNGPLPNMLFHTCFFLFSGFLQNVNNCVSYDGSKTPVPVTKQTVFNLGLHPNCFRHINGNVIHSCCWHWDRRKRESEKNHVWKSDVCMPAGVLLHVA